MNKKPGDFLRLLIPLAIGVALAFLATLILLNECGKTSLRNISLFAETLVENNVVQEQSILNAFKESRAQWSADDEALYLARYGYGSRDFSGRFIVTASLLVLIPLISIYMVFLAMIRNRNRDKQNRIKELTEYLEQVNINAPGTIVRVREDEFSHLQDEIYKTVTTLYQTRETALQAKLGYADNLANIAHQMKTPLTAALLFLQLEECSDSRARALRMQLERMTRLSETLLTLSQIDAGVLCLEDTDVDVYTVLSLAADNLSDLFSGADVSVQIQEKGCVEIRGDMEWTMQALMNLMKNCLEHSPRGGVVHCDYDQNPLYVTLMIWDEGNGFDPADIPRLFERFYRGNNASSGGIGIGLALTKSIVELQNGCISARNLPSGGACFEIHFYSH